jgi:hypothetical protein
MTDFTINWTDRAGEVHETIYRLVQEELSIAQAEDKLGTSFGSANVGVVNSIASKPSVFVWKPVT